MNKKLYYAVNLIIFFILGVTFLLTTNWLHLLHEKYQFDLEFYVLKLVWSWRFLFYGDHLEVLFNLLIGPSFLLTYFLCRRKKYQIPYLLVICLSLILLQECYYLTNFRLALPKYTGGGGCGIRKEFIPLQFLPFYFEFGVLLILQSYLFYQSKDNYHLITIHKQYVAYAAVVTFYILLIYFAIFL